MSRRCAGPCARALVAYDATPGPGQVTHRGRGMCGTCHDVARHDGTLSDYPRTYLAADVVLDDWEILRSGGATREEAAERLGLKLASFERVLQRHRDDPRAVLGARRRERVK